MRLGTTSGVTGDSCFAFGLIFSMLLEVSGLGKISGSSGVEGARAWSAIAGFVMKASSESNFSKSSLSLFISLRLFSRL